MPNSNIAVLEELEEIAETLPSVNVAVHDEFGVLKEVIIGSKLAPEDKVLTWTSGMDEEFKWMKKETMKYLKDFSGQTWKDAGYVNLPTTLSNPLLQKGVLYETINEQVERYAEIVEERGVNVWRMPRLVGEDRNYINPGIEQCWPRDVWCTAGNTVIVSSLRMSWKRKQQFAGLPLYTKLLSEDKCKYIAAPQASTEILSPPLRKKVAEQSSILFDGGDFLVNGKEIYLGIGHGSNMLGAKFVGTVLPDYKIFPIKLGANALHLDCAIALLSPGFGLRCKAWLPAGFPDSIPGDCKLKSYKWIDVDEKDASWLACNGLPIDPETVIMDSRHEALIERVRATFTHIEVIDIPYDGPSFLGGAFRCSSQPLVREKAS